MEAEFVITMILIMGSWLTLMITILWQANHNDERLDTRFDRLEIRLEAKSDNNTTKIENLSGRVGGLETRMGGLENPG